MKIRECSSRSEKDFCSLLRASGEASERPQANASDGFKDSPTSSKDQKMAKNVRGYCRVSTDLQIDGVSLEVQETQISNYCRDHNCNLGRPPGTESASASNGP